MADDCGRCPALQAELSRAHGEIQHLRRQLDYLTAKFTALLGAVRSLLAFLIAETEEPTMPRQRLIPAVMNRLELMRDEAEERR